MDNFKSCDVSFRIIDENLNHLEITKMLSIIPEIAYNKGDPNIIISKKGKIINSSSHSAGLWSIKSTLVETSPFEDHLNYLLKMLMSLKDKLNELHSRGYKMDFFCGLFTNENIHSGFEINSNILYNMGILNIKLSICIY